MHAKKWLAAILCVYVAQWVDASDCSSESANAMVQAYCQIQAAGFGAGLPSLREFKQNPEKTQRLLLLRPAQRAGVTLPEEPKPVRSRAPAKHVPERTVKPADEVLSCQVQGDWVLCGSQRYRLLGNSANKDLAAGALTPATQLRLAQFTGSVNDRDWVLRYLDESYRSYVDAMITIGLAGSTLSFTKFYHTFMEVQSAGANFAERMATMFEYLKEDKKAMAVKAHFSELRPSNISQCRQLNQITIVCDDVKNNWIFRLHGA